MARGWESNSAEEQAAQQEEQRSEAAKGGKKQLAAADAAHARARQLLELKRERILSEKTSHPVRRAALQAALAEIETELARLDG